MPTPPKPKSGLSRVANPESESNSPLLVGEDAEKKSTAQPKHLPGKLVLPPPSLSTQGSRSNPSSRPEEPMEDQAEEPVVALNLPLDHPFDATLKNIMAPPPQQKLSCKETPFILALAALFPAVMWYIGSKTGDLFANLNDNPSEGTRLVSELGFGFAMWFTVACLGYVSVKNLYLSKKSAQNRCCTKPTCHRSNTSSQFLNLFLITGAAISTLPLGGLTAKWLVDNNWENGAKIVPYIFAFICIPVAFMMQGVVHYLPMKKFASKIQSTARNWSTRAERQTLENRLNKKIHEIKTCSDGELNNLYQRVFPAPGQADYRHLISINQTTKMDLYGHNTASTLGFLIGGIGAYIYYTVGRISVGWLLSLVKAQNETAEISLSIVAYAFAGMLAADKTMILFGSLWDYFKQCSCKAKRQNYQVTGKAVLVLAAVMGIIAGGSQVYFAVDNAIKNDWSAGFIFLLCCVSTAPTSVRFWAANQIGQGVLWQHERKKYHQEATNLNTPATISITRYRRRLLSRSCEALANNVANLKAKDVSAALTEAGREEANIQNPLTP